MRRLPPQPLRLHLSPEPREAGCLYLRIRSNTKDCANSRQTLSNSLRREAMTCGLLTLADDTETDVV